MAGYVNAMIDVFFYPPFTITSKLLAMSFFDKSRNFLISGGQFTSITTKTDTRKKGIDLLYEHTAPGAFHNSAERYDPPKCHPNTRIAVIQAIVDWVEDDQKTTSIKWMHGAAGAGKSAIAQEIAEQHHASGCLAASFFWSRSATGRNDEKRLIPSLAYQLAISIPQIRNHVEEVVETDPSIFNRSIEAQMESLIVRPLEKAFGHGREVPVNHDIPKLIILDGLDECGTPQAQQYVLKVIAHSVRKFPLPLFFLIASRPEQAIRDSFYINPLLDITAGLVLDERYHPDDDIRLFLVASFKSVISTHKLRLRLPHVWPTENDIDHLVRKSSGQFIYPATVVKFVSTSRRMPDKQLDIILGITATEKDTPFAELDALYHHVFSSVEDPPRALEILSLLFLVRDSDAHQVDFIEAILSYSPGELQLILIDLHSVMEVPDVGDEHSKLRVLHGSLQDFLMDPTRSRTFCIDKGQAHACMAQHLLQYINNYFLNASNAEFNQEFTSLVFQSLEYHCSLSSPTRELLHKFFDFNFLKWASEILEWTPGHSAYYMHVYFEIIRLYGWLQAQEAKVQCHFGLEYSLSIHHSHSWEVVIDLLCKKFCDRCFGADKDIITTAITYPQILDHYNQDYFIKPLEPFNKILNCNILDGCLRDIAAENKVPVELQKYLCDPERAGTYLVHGGTYATLSVKILKFIFGTFEQFEEQWQAEDNIGVHEGSNSTILTDGLNDRGYYLSFAIQLLPFYLSNANYEPELARHASEVSTLKFRIQDHKGALIDMKEFHQAIDLYLEKKPPMPKAESRLQKKRHLHGSSEESLEAANLSATNMASSLIPPPPKRLRLMDLLNPDTGSESDIHLHR